MKTIEIPLTRGYVALIDEGDAERVLEHRWSAVPIGRTVYAQRAVKRSDGRWTSQRLHTFLTGYAVTDHRNGDGLDNRRANLRQATQGQNVCNQQMRSDNTSGFKGVTWFGTRGPWVAQIQHKRKHHSLGFYQDPAEAGRAYDEAARRLHGEHAALNFPEPGERPARKVA